MYDMNIFWSEEDDRFLVKVPSLPGCYADGRTRVQAVAAGEVAIQEWIETARENNRDIPQPDYHANVFA